MLELGVQTVLFDLDGTLVDSSASVQRAWRAVAEELAVPIERFVPLMHGIPANEVLARVVPQLPPARAAQISERMLAAQADDTDDVRPTAGALALLEALPVQRWAVVTSGDRRLATARIRAAGLPMPLLLVTAEDVAAGKPDPACYLHAAEASGVPASRCLVVEDAPAGVSAGRAADMPVLGVLTTHDRLDQATWTIADLARVRMRADQGGVQVTGLPLW